MTPEVITTTETASEAYVAERMGQIAVAHARVNEIHQEMRRLNQELGTLQNDVWGWQCDISRVEHDSH